MLSTPLFGELLEQQQPATTTSITQYAKELYLQTIPI
jgi:hypothetical protein